MEASWNRAIDYATIKHFGQKRIGGEPYITHPIAVADYLRSKGFGLDFQLAGLFHDLMEDTNATLREITDLSNFEVAEVVQLLTKNKGINLETYLDKISKNKMALIVKIADRIHNLRQAKIADLTFRQKYIAESMNYYFIPAILSPFYKDFREALDQLHNTITEEFFCKGCKLWHHFDDGVVLFTKDNLPMCKASFAEYQKSFHEYEKFLTNDEENID